MNVLITICGRGGSKGIVGKNIRLIGGKPLIAYTIDIANWISNKLNAVISLSTDSDEIKSIAEAYGLYSSYERPAELATDTAGKIDTIKHLLLYEEQLRGKRFDLILDLDITSPIRTRMDLEKSFLMMEENKEALTLFSVNPANRNPYFNMVEETNDGYVVIAKTPVNGSVLTRQTAPKVYDLNASFYIYRRLFFDMNLKSPITNRSLAYVMDHICFDLDHPHDFDFLEYLIQSNKIQL